ncbi:MAG: hypothetical protein M1540_01030 [Candidatus Bathyarchaeota archaeon]|nr:hypothetical protein [Chloroflexota bacterium]MCL5876380.1 hypothetical protein [Candidatus Bathyarchaeota archaeon]
MQIVINPTSHTTHHESQPFHQTLAEYRKQLQNSAVKAAYQSLIGYVTQLRHHLKKTHPAYFVSEVHPGMMDHTYFYFIPQTLKRQKLKTTIIFFHDNFKFEVWLSGCNKAVQARYWKQLKEADFTKSPLAAEKRGNSIIEHTLSSNPDFTNLEALTSQLETALTAFLKDIETTLFKQG